MKVQLPKLKNYLPLVTLLSVFGAFSIAQAQIIVDLRVSGDESKLKTMTHGTCQASYNSNGCIGASGRVLINFNLIGKTECSSGGNWELDKVVLSEKKDSKTGISEVAAADFNADEATGVVTPKLEKLRKIQIRDHNTEDYIVWYTVSAYCAAGESTIYLDPRIRNDGSG